ncbi:MAG: cytochrome P450 [Alphaproteobacteria bacterium]|nr:cytochrome P450 [Alphaproteobacteria bacterium]
MTDSPARCPVRDWASDYDIFDPDYVRDPAPVWKELRERCPIAHTERWGGSWLPTRYEHLQKMVKMVPALSSASPLVVPPSPEMIEILEAETEKHGETSRTPPITSDPPRHRPYRRIIMPLFSPHAVEKHIPYTRDLCNGLIDGFIGEGRADAAADYAEQITPRVIAHILGIDPARADEFVTWVRGVLEFGLTEPEQMVEYRTRIRTFFQEMVTERRETPRGDAISMLIASEAEGEKLTDYRILGMCSLLLIAGIDTTWSAISSSLLHFATHPADQARLRAEPELLPTAVEELLRFYAPVTMGRIVTEPVEIDGAEMQEGDRVLLNFPGANRDPEAFERADEVVLDRRRNRHMAFGLGIHRCAGSNLARMEMQVALRTWFDRIGEFELADPDAVTWAGGQVRGPRAVPVRFAAT